jgi:hypothetical protein
MTNFIESTSTSALISRPSKSSSEIIRELIFMSKSNRTNISFVFRELLRSMITYFSQFAIIDDKDEVIPVKCIHANPERAIAKLTQDQNLILPIISIHQPKSLRQKDRQKYKPMIVAESIWDEKKQKALRLVSLVPTPIEIEYQINIWCKYKNDLDQLTEQIQYAFNPDIEITTDQANNIKLYIKEESSDSDFVLNDREDRLLKRSFSITANTYIPSPKFLMTSTGKIERYNYEVEVTNKLT